MRRSKTLRNVSIFQDFKRFDDVGSNSDGIDVVDPPLPVTPQVPSDAHRRVPFACAPSLPSALSALMHQSLHLWNGARTPARQSSQDNSSNTNMVGWHGALDAKRMRSYYVRRLGPSRCIHPASRTQSYLSHPAVCLDPPSPTHLPFAGTARVRALHSLKSSSPTMHAALLCRAAYTALA